MYAAREATEPEGRHVDRRADRLAERPATPHVARHVAVAAEYGEPADVSSWSTAYSDGADRARLARLRLRTESRVERRGRLRRRDRA